MIQMTVRAQDNPGQNAVPRFDTAFVRITVTRNPNTPQFRQSVYNITISEYMSVQDLVINTDATDADPVGVSMAKHKKHNFGAVSYF